MQEIEQLKEEYLVLVRKSEKILQRILDLTEDIPDEGINKLRILLNDMSDKTNKEEDNKKFNELVKINGIGKETVEDIRAIFETYNNFLLQLKSGNKLPLRNDIEEKLRQSLIK